MNTPIDMDGHWNCSVCGCSWTFYEAAMKCCNRVQPKEQVKVKDLYPDSVEVGTPAKGGALKVYFDASNETAARERVENAHRILKYTRELMEVK